MRSSRLFLFLVATTAILYAAGASASGVDMKDPRRALGREDDVRIDAQLFQDTLSSSSPVNVTYQIENFTASPVAVADKICDVSYDKDTQTITVSIGSEIPSDGVMPHVATIAPGQKKVLTSGGVVNVAVPNVRSPFVIVPRYVQIKVNVLRDVVPFRELIAGQSHTSLPQRLTDQQFDQWIEANDVILLNAIPVRWKSGGHGGLPDVERGAAGSY